MSGADNDYIQWGWWTDHGAGRSYVLVKEETSVMISNMLAVTLALSLTRLLVFVKLGWNWLTMKIQACAYQPTQADETDPLLQGMDYDDTDLQPIPPAHRRHNQTLDAINATISNAPSLESIPGRMLRRYVFVPRPTNATPSQERSLRTWLSDQTRHMKAHSWQATGGLTLSVLFLAIFAGYQVIAVYASRIVGSITVRSNSPYSGSWSPNIPDSPVHITNTSVLTMDYNSEDCALFYKRRIGHYEHHNVTCPYRGGLCSQGMTSAFELDTGFQSATIVGINLKHTAQFRFKMVCSPVVAEPPYIRSKIIDSFGTRQVDYLYGDGWGIVNDGNKTFGEVVQDPAHTTWAPAQYMIREIKGNVLRLPGSTSPRQWIPELDVPDSRVFLYFILPLNILYTNPSTDPIFPATVLAAHMEIGNPLYTTPNQHSTVLACTDSMTFRNPMSNATWFPRYQNLSQLHLPEWKHYHDVVSSLHIMNASYLASELFKSRYTSLADYSNAPWHIHDFYSSPLDPEQWKVEARRIFEARLSIFQYHFRGVASGQAHSLPHAENALKNYGVDARGKVLFQARGWKNIKVLETGLLLGVCVGLWVAPIEIGDTVLLIWVMRKIKAQLDQKVIGDWFQAVLRGLKRR
ncbi:hypothetical protein P154DRAFT_109934 [Amniculicola lignicola CBS 123094]|uniref:Uncharacterized protein n=1 Tax=Amniculicola lignicola CBS 123094 TaxID=1392246 RepID=A0A6A5WS99_9PLEO|nr:hypothetical protein P154DRAFT_109934 [Amniculicola lignicola CBS 123094]